MVCIIRCLEQAPRTAAPPLCWGPSGSIPADQNDACRAIARGGYVAESRASTGLVRLFLSRLCANTETGILRAMVKKSQKIDTEVWLKADDNLTQLESFLMC